MANTGHSNTKGQPSFLKKRFLQNVGAGEKLGASEFEMTFDDYPNINVRVRNTQMPGERRTGQEDFGPMGLKFVQYGPRENSGELTVMCVETIKGDVLAFLTKVVRDKEYLKMTIRPTPESLNGASPKGTTCRLEHCMLVSEPLDISTEDAAALVKPTITITYNWKEYE